jgi:two-component system, NtrC family, sensor histidine kinase HydH
MFRFTEVSDCATDIELNDNERQRLLAQYSEIATLAGGLAHEIRNPLSTMGLNLELLKEELEGADNPRDRRMLLKVDRVHQQCEQLNEILSAFLQFARVGELNTDEVDLNAIVNDFVDDYSPTAKEQDVEIIRHLESNLPLMPLDAALFTQVLINLTQNAVQSMPDGGNVELQTHRRGDAVMLDVIDNGPGMTDKTKSKLFQVFFSTKPSGSGLGLSTVRKIVEAHDGSIRCESEVGKGTRFSISLPIPE